MSELIRLRAGAFTEDPRLDRLDWFDEASRNYQIREVIEDAPNRSSKGRAHLPAVTLNQRREGQCVNDACTDARNGSPDRQRPLITDFYARREAYHQMQHDDPWRGCYLGARCPIEPDPANGYGGTAILAGARYGKQHGWWREYRWIGAGSGRLEDDIIDTLRGVGGIVFGIPWLQGMYRTSPSGLVEVSGSRVGAHAIHGFEWAPRQRMPRHWKGTRPGVWWHNTWGPQPGEEPENTGGYGVSRRGVTGCAFIQLDDLLRLLENRQGEGMVPLV